MKKIILLSFLLALSLIKVNAQQKILFDCSTGESASNADWVIDADTHNLNSDWPTTTGGSESNPQQIPTPAQSGISGSTSETFWNGALSAWGVECVKYNSGWTIETLPYDGLITYGDGSNPQDLSNYKVFVLDEPNSLFSASEKTAIVNFVNAGGGLFLISDHDVADRNGDGDDAVDAINDLLTSSGGFNNGLGMTLDYANFTDAPTTNVIASGGGDPLIDGTYGPITAMEFHGATSMTINTSNNSTVKGVVYKTGATLGGTTGVMVAYCTYGSSNGRVVLITDSSPADDGTGDSGDSLYDGWDQQSGDNGNIHMNATIWLMGAGSTAPTLTVSPTTLTGYTYVVGGGPSTSQSFTLSGSNLDGTQVTVSGSTNYEVSLDNTTFGSSVNVSYTAPTLNNTTIYIRLKAGLLQGTYNGETITCSDDGTASDVTVSNDGEVTADATGTTTCEDFSGLNEGSYGNYSFGEFDINNGLCNSTNARTNNAVRLRNSSSSYLELVGVDGNGVDGGVGDISFWYRAWDSSPTAVYDVSASINGGAYSTIGTINTSSTTYAEFTYTLNNSSDNIKIKIQNTSGERLHIDDFCYTNYSAASGPEIKISGNSTEILSGDNTPDASDDTEFGDVCTGVTATATFTIENVGTSDLTLSGTPIVAISGSGDFSISTQPTSSTISAAGSETFVVSYTPFATGRATATISIANDDTDENPYTFDVHGTGVCTEPTIASPTSANVTTTTADLGGDITNIGCNNVTERGVYYSTTSGFSAPAGTKVSETGTYGTGTFTVNATGLTDGTTYYYQAFAKNSCGTVYGTEASFTTLKAEPTNHVTNFACGGVTSATMDLTWTDATGGTVPEGYLILWNTTGTFSDPVDGTPQADGAGVQNIAQGTEAYTVTGLTQNTTYYFIIYPYTNSGANIDYNINATVPVTNCTTLVSTSCASDLIISEYGEGSSGNSKYIEIYNGTGSSVTLSNYRIWTVLNGGTWPENTYDFTTATLADGATLVIANNSSDVPGADEYNLICSWNGDDAVGLAKNDGGWALIDAIGTDGADPGSAWNVAGTTNGTKDHYLVRKATVTSPTTNWSTSAGTDASNSEWVVTSYTTGSAQTGYTMSCTCTEPTIHASNITFTSITSTSMNVNWTNGDGLNRIVVAREANAVNWTPTDNNTYAANSSFGSGTQLGTGNYVVYNGSSNTVNVTNLTPGTTYYFKIFEYGCQAGSEDYLTSGTPAEGNETTLPNDVTNFQVDCTTATTANLSWTLPAGSYDGIMIAALPNAIPDNPTCAGNTLISPNTDFSAANVYCGNASGAVYVYNNVGTNVTITGLTSGTSYHFMAFTYKNDAWSSGNEIIQTAEVSDVSDFYSTCGNGESLLSWTNPDATCFDEVIIAVNTSSVTGIPSGTYTANSLDYTDGANPTLSDGSVIVYNGTTSPQTVTGLTNGTTYFFKVFVRSGTDWSSGVEVSCAATTASFFDYGDLAIVGINTDYTNLPNDDSDEIQFICFKDITTETSIDFTDNGYERLYAGKWADSEGTITLTRTGADVPAGTVITVRGRNAASNWHVFIGSGTPNGSLTNDDANWAITDGGAGNNVFDLNVNDQIWMMQGGTWNNPGGAHNATYSGKVLYGWTAIGWEPAPGYDDTKGSTIFPSSACSVSNLVGVANEDKVRYDSTITAATQRDWISRFNDEQQWTGYADSTTYQNGGTLPDIITISAAGFAGVYKWTGETSSDWDDCTNWLNLKVPDASADVQFVSDDCSNDLVILPGQTVICKSLEITGSTLNHSIKAEGDATAVIEVHGDLTIGGPAGVLDFDDGTSAADGTLKIYGNWYENTDGGFLEGNSSVEFIGSVSQSINTVSSEAGFYNLKIDNSSAFGVALANIASVTGTLNLAGGILNLNGSDLTISGTFTGTNGVFAGHQWSNLTVNGIGAISYNFNFASPQQLSRFNMNRTGEIAVIGTNLTVDDLQIDAGSIELSAGKYYTVNNSITNTPGTNGLVLKSDATGTASLIQPSSSIQATCERYMEGGKWNFFFTPLNNVATSIFNSGNPNFYYYDETPADYWDATTIYGTTGWTAESTGTLSTNKGYIQYYNSAKTYNLTGGTLYEPAAGSKIFTLSSTNSGTGSVGLNGVTADWDDFEGWNFIGNPFTSAFDWNQVNLSNVENVIYYSDGSNYKYYGGGTSYNQGITVNGGSQFIPANQGFFVKATVNNGTLEIPLAARTHNAQSFWKKNQNIPDNFMKLSIENNGFTDETVIRTLSEATEEHDAKYDAYKLFSYDKSKPMLYSRNDDNSHIYAINSVPNFGNEKIIPLGIYIGTESYYTISLTENSFNKMHIYLEDNLLNETVNLIVHSSYSFYQQPTDFSDRFKIRFKLNSKPKLTGNIPDQIIDVNKIYSYTVPNTIFNEKDEGDSLNYSVSLDNGNALPEWLIFDSETRTFTGKPEETGDLNIKVTVKDIFGASVSDIYKLTVTTESFVQNISDDGVSVYPNPTDGKFIIEFMKPVKGIISIIDLSGKVLMIKSIHSNLTNIDLRKFGEGVYIVDIKTDNQIIKKRIIIK